jgi:hypothetical protein
MKSRLRRLERWQRERLGEFASEEELNLAIEAELSRIPSWYAEQVLREFAAENGLEITL